MVIAAPANFLTVRRILLMIAGLTVLVAIAYWPVYRYGVVQYDDPVYLYNNPFIKLGVTAASLHDAFFRFRFANYAPLVSISYNLDQDLFGLRPGPMHVENVVMHLIAGLLLWRVLFVATGRRDASYVVAGLFLCHPMHVESVAWLSERKDVLSTDFLFLTMLAYLEYVRRPRSTRNGVYYLLMLLLFALSLMTKTMGVTLPAVLLLMDYWPLARWRRESWILLIIEKIPLLVLSAAASVLGILAQHHAGATASLDSLALTDRIGNAVVCYVLYVSKLLVPMSLAALYPHPGERPATAVFAAALLLMMVTLFVWRVRRRFAYALVGWLWFVGTLVPVIGVFQVGSQAMADRYSYFPSVGLFILLVWGGRDLLRKWIDADHHHRRWITLATGVVTAMFIASTALARVQVSYWRDSESLFSHDIQVVGDNPTALIVLGGVAAQKGNMKTAVDDFTAALKNGPNARANFALANAWWPDNPQLARKYFRKAVDLEPRSIEFRIGYADALLQEKDTEGAKAQVQAALDVDSTDPLAIKEWKKIGAGTTK